VAGDAVKPGNRAANAYRPGESRFVPVTAVSVHCRVPVPLLLSTTET